MNGIINIQNRDERASTNLRNLQVKDVGIHYMFDVPAVISLTNHKIIRSIHCITKTFDIEHLMRR